MYDKIGKVTLQYRFIVMETGCLFCLGSSNSKFPASLYKLDLASSWTIDTPQHPACSLPFQRSFFRGHYFSPRSGFLWCLSFWCGWSCVKLFTPDFLKISKLHNWKLRSVRLRRSNHVSRERKSCFTLICFWWSSFYKVIFISLYSLFILEQLWQTLEYQ